uniref:Uncharacterized protein n=1 Tax=Hubei odonate virus 15 TaxID=1922996 RepID=A0A1L3KP34_9VIRU|nr:hypothetical protein 3 [Hubei odonate virus 15]
MALRVLVRSVKAANRPASIRPDSISIYVQLDIYHDHLTADAGKWTKQVSACKQNVTLLPERLVNDGLYVANPFRFIKDVVICEVNNEDDDDYQSLEDGRSRRYFYRTAIFAHMYSVPIEECYLPVTFSRYACTKNTGNFCINQLRFYRKGPKMIELMVSCVGGKNLPKYSEVTVDEYKKDLAAFDSLSDRVVLSLKQWCSLRAQNRYYIVLLMKDHCAPLEAHDPRKYLLERGRKWHLPSLESSAVEASATAGWWDIYGWQSNIENLSVDMIMYDWDDHTPCMFDISLPFKEVDALTARKLSREYYIDKPWKEMVTVRKHDGKKVNIF